MAPRTEDPTPAPRRATVTPDLDGARLDHALVELFPDLSRSRLQEWIRDGGVHLGGEPVARASLRVAADDRVELVVVPRARERRGAAPGLDFRVVHEDDALVVIDKPAGMVVHPSELVRGGTVAELAAERWGELPAPQGEDRPGIVHRLDAETSGLLVLARTPEAAEALLAQFRERTVDKLYLAVAHGDPRFDSDWIEVAIGRSPRHPDRMSVLRDEDPGGRQAATFYEVRERFGSAALVACSPKTGRTHQIRVHLSWLDHPVVGDRLYRGKRGSKHALPSGVQVPGRHALHAHRLAFRHPVSGEGVSFEAPLAPELAQLVEALRATSAGS